MRVSIVVPVLNDAPALADLLEILGAQTLGGVEILVVDGGSDGDPLASVRPGAAHCRVLQSPRGRGAQLALGARAATGRWIWLLHADAAPEPACLRHLLARDDAPAWGCFDVHLDGGGRLRAVAALMNLRSRLTGICTGDQGIFVHTALLDAVGGVPAQPLMEDIELCRRLKRHGWPVRRRETVSTSPRRWLARGVLRTILSMWWFRLRYWRGADPVVLARDYYR